MNFLEFVLDISISFSKIRKVMQEPNSKFRVTRLTFESRSMGLAFLSENGRVLVLKIMEE